MAQLTAQEVMTAFNYRSALGRVVISPPDRMAPLIRHDTLPMYLCCGRAFLTEESYQKHKTETEVHGKPIDLSNVRMALHDRKSIEFWRSRKHKAAKKFTESGEEEENDDEDNGDDNKLDTEEDRGPHEFEQPDKAPRLPKLKVQNIRRKTIFSQIPRKRSYNIKICSLCKISMPGCNMIRHMRICHDPNNQFRCRFCTCQFVQEFGLVVHERKVHNVGRVPTPRVRRLKNKLMRPSSLLLSSTPETPFNENNFVKLESGKFECNVCKKIILGLRNIKDHLNSHFGRKPYKCPLCLHCFSFASNVTRHLKTCHIEDGQYICPYSCGCSMESETSLKTHMSLCMLKEKAQATYNKVKLEPGLPKRKPILQQVLEQPEINNDYENKSSIMGPEQLKNKYKHALVAPNLYHCDLCNKNVASSSNYRDHLNSHAGIRPHNCPKCEMTFTFKSNIRRHIETSHVPNGSHKCPLNCGCVMSCDQALHSHLNTCKKRQMRKKVQVKTEPIIPPQKPQTIRRRKIQDTDFNPSSKHHQCNICKKVVISKRNLQNHMLIHLNLKPWKCQLCGFSFRAVESLKKHQAKSHNPNGKHRCPMCPCQFLEYQGLSMHTAIFHLKTWRRGKSPIVDDAPVPKTTLPPLPKLTKKPSVNGIIEHKVEQKQTKSGGFECHICQKSLQTQSTLRNHLLIHSGEKPHECEFCGHLFRRPSTLWDHKRTSHSGGQYKCSDCTCQFKTEMGLNRHRGVFHGINSPNYLRRRVQRIRKKALKLNIKFPFSVKSRPEIDNNQRFTNTVSPVKKIVQTLPQKTNLQQPNQLNMKNNRSALFQCGHCSLALPTLHALSDHQRVHTNQKSPIIPHQDFSPSTSSQLFPPKCPICEYKIHTSSHYRTHMKACHGNGKFQCSFCPCRFESQGSLSRHYTERHPNGKSLPDIPYHSDVVEEKMQRKLTPLNRTSSSKKEKNDLIICKICSKAFKHQWLYKQHITIHQNIKPFKCDICNLRFRLPGILTSHKKTSHGEGKFVCKLCTSTRFKTLKGLSVHKFVYHKGGRIGKYGTGVEVEPDHNQMQNDICNRSYGFDPEPGHSRVTHTKKSNSSKSVSTVKVVKSSPKKKPIHQNIKKYKCDICSLRFRLPGILATHKRTSHGQGEFVCKLCTSTRFKTLKGLSVHQFVYHKGGRIGGNDTGVDEVETDQMQNDICNGGYGFDPEPGHSRVTHTKSKSISPVKVVKSSPKNRPMACKICGKMSLGPEKLIEHMKLHQSKKNRTIVQNVQAEDILPQLESVGERFYNEDFFSQEQEEEEDGPAFEIMDHEELNIDDDDSNTNPYETYNDDAIEYIEEDDDDIEYDTGEPDIDPFGGMDDNHNQEYEFEYTNQQSPQEEDVEQELDDDDQYIQYYEHENDQSDIYDQPIECQGCGLSFLSRDDFAFHVQVDIGGNSSCPYCCTENITVDNLQDHCDAVHSIDEVEFLESQR